MLLRLNLSLLLLVLTHPISAQLEQDYTVYHKNVNQAEALIAKEAYQEAFTIYEDLFQEYDFIFLREYQVASQLALKLKEEAKALKLIERGILGGWKLKSIRKNTHLATLWTKPEWKAFKKTYTTLNAQYEDQLNTELKAQVKKMFAKDQKKALLVLFRISSKAQDRYAEKKFAPHSIQQMAELKAIMEKHIYPGDRLIGPNYWISTILSHHNSISQSFNQQDQIYPTMKPLLQKAIKAGYLAPAEWALIDEWYRIVKQETDQAHYGFIKEPKVEELDYMNQLRASINLRSVELRNQLIDLEQKTGMDFYLPNGWIEGKIEVHKGSTK